MPLECQDCGNPSETLFAIEKAGVTVCQNCFDRRQNFDVAKPAEPVKIELHPEDIRNQWQ